MSRIWWTPVAPAETDHVRPTRLLLGNANRLAGAAGRLLVTESASPGEVLAALEAFPTYWAVMLYEPTARLLVVMLA